MFEEQPSSALDLDALRLQLQARLNHAIGAHDVASLAIQFDCARNDVTVELVAIGASITVDAPPQFLAYSITKSMIAVLVLQLVQTRRCELTTSITRWLPTVPNARAITLQHLLNHTAGLSDYGALPAYKEAVRDPTRQPWTFDEYAVHTYEQHILFAPGQGWAYSNPGYMLLKRILELETEASFASLVEARIAQPLGLRHTFVAETKADLQRLVPAYTSSFDDTAGLQDVRAVYHPDWVSHGVVAATARDIATFYQQLFCGTLLPPGAVQQMTTAVSVPDAPDYYGDAGYGLGLMIATPPRHGLLWGHNGGGPGYQASAFHAPARRKHGVTVCVMVAGGADGLDAEQLVFATLELLETDA